MKFERADGVKSGGFPLVSPSVPSSAGRVVSLLSLSANLPISLIDHQLTSSLRNETGAPVVLVRLEPGITSSARLRRDHGQATVVDWAPWEEVLQSQSAVLPTPLKTPEGFHFVNLSLSDQPMTAERVGLLLDYLLRSFRHIVIEIVGGQVPGPVQREFLSRSGLVFLLFQPCGTDPAERERLEAEIREQSRQPTARVRTICCLPQEKQVDGFEFLGRSHQNGPHSSSLSPGGTNGERVGETGATRLESRLGPLPVPTFIHDCPTLPPTDQIIPQVSPTAQFRADVRRLAREISGRLVGLALSSGAAKGFAHIGVIQVLEENGVEVDVVAGASIGAYIGALWTFGHNGKELERLAREMESRWGFWSLFDLVFPPRRGFLRGFALRKRLMRSIGSARFADLPRPLRVITSNLATLDRVAFAAGEIAAAVHASMAVPGICVPVTIDGEMYIDGGIVDPVPVDVLREMGAAHVIAVNVIPTPERIRQGFEAERQAPAKKENRARKLFRKVLPIDKQLNYFAPGNLFEIVVRSVHGAQVRLAEASCRLADIVLRPDTGDDRWLDCRNPGRFIALGRHAAEQHLEQIKALVARKEVTLESELAPEPMAAVA